MQRSWIFGVAVGFNICAIVCNSWQNGMGHVFNLFFVGNILLICLFRRHVKIMLKGFSGLAGLPETQTGYVSIGSYLSTAKKTIAEMQRAISHINEIGQQAFGDVVQGIEDAGIRSSLLSANDKIIGLRRKENEINWITQGLAAIAELKQSGNDITQYSDQVISTIVKYIGANQGSFFLLKGEGDDAHFELTAAYAYGKKKFLEKHIHVGEGLIGQVFYERDVVYITDVPNDYVKITSGLGEALPRCICIVPLLSDGEVHGVIEIASFKPLQPQEMEYLKKIGQNIGYNLGAIETHRRTELLLEESQKMAQEVKSQEEELRQNMEELTETQEQMRRKQTEMDAVLSSLSTVELDLDGAVLAANDIFLGITGYTLKDIQRKLYKSLIPQQGNDTMQYEMMWSSILSGRSFSGEFRIVNKAHKEIWMAGNFTPILNDEGKPYKVMVISLFTTQDKEKLFELQELVAAFKGCFPMAEINPDFTFKTANDLFLSELGIKRIELKKSLPKTVLESSSYLKLEKYLTGNKDQPDSIELDIQTRNGEVKRFNSTLVKINNNGDQRKKGLLILRNVL